MGLQGVRKLYKDVYLLFAMQGKIKAQILRVSDDFSQNVFILVSQVIHRKYFSWKPTSFSVQRHSS